MNLKNVVVTALAAVCTSCCCFLKAERRMGVRRRRVRGRRSKSTASPSKGIWRVTLRIAMCSYIFLRVMPPASTGATRLFTSFTATPPTPRTTGTCYRFPPPLTPPSRTDRLVK